jgi:hypothetical protein
MLSGDRSWECAAASWEAADGKPGQSGKDWWGSVTGFQRPGSIDFHHTIHVRQLRATVDVHIHYFNALTAVPGESW